MPDSHCPIGGGTDESVWMEVVPSNLIDCQQMAGICFLILTRISSRTFMNLTFFSTNEENLGIELIEVKA